MKKKIYIDMDGVVADFNRNATLVLGHDKQDINSKWSDAEWDKVKQLPHFYRTLPLMPRASEMMDLALRFRDSLGYELRMLTAIPQNNDMPDCIHDKIDWMADYWPDIRVHFGPYSEDKQNHCTGPNDILVDDKPSNIEEWRARGGRAVEVTADYELALTELRAILDSELAQQAKARAE
jgi:5'(3')-deoxyribonucleotidase